MSSAEAAAVLGERFCEALRVVVRDELASQPPHRRFFTKEALAEHFGSGVTARTIKEWRARGLRGHKVGRKVMYDLNEVNRWIEQHS